jgi:hypothetical protein
MSRESKSQKPPKEKKKKTVELKDKPSNLSAERILDSDIEAVSNEDSLPKKSKSSKSKDTQVAVSTVSKHQHKKRKIEEDKEVNKSGKKTKTNETGKSAEIKGSKQSTKASSKKTIITNGKSSNNGKNSAKSVSQDNVSPRKVATEESISEDALSGDDDSTEHLTAESATDEEDSTADEEVDNGKSLVEDIPISKDLTMLSDSSESEGSDDSGSESEANDTAQPVTHSEPSTPLTYKAPNGFSRASFGQLNPSIKTMFSPSNLKGKKMWHITAPSSLPINQIKELGAVEISQGSSVITYENIDYGFEEELPDSTTPVTLLIPTEKSDKYQLVPKKVGKILHLRQVVKLPELGNYHDDEARRPNTITGSHKAKLQQPQGLRMRYRPLGDESHISDEENVEPFTPSDNQAKQGSISTQSPKAAKSIKSKKNQKQTSLENDLEMDLDIPTSSPVATKTKSGKHAGETSEERALRKAEKARRKEEKLKRKNAAA